MNVDDVLVLLRRVFGVLEATVGPPIEPFRVLPHPGMIGCALDGKVERDVEAVPLRLLNEPCKLAEAPELGVNGVVTTFGAPYRVRAARLSGLGRESIVAALAVEAPNGVNRCEVENIEAQIPYVGQTGDHIIERAVPP